MLNIAVPTQPNEIKETPLSLYRDGISATIRWREFLKYKFIDQTRFTKREYDQLQEQKLDFDYLFRCDIDILSSISIRPNLSEYQNVDRIFKNIKSVPFTLLTLAFYKRDWKEFTLLLNYVDVTRERTFTNFLNIDFLNNLRKLGYDISGVAPTIEKTSILVNKLPDPVTLLRLALNKREWQIFKFLLDYVDLTQEHHIDLLFSLSQLDYSPLETPLKIENINALLDKSPNLFAVLLDRKEWKLFRYLLDHATLTDENYLDLLVSLYKRDYGLSEITLKGENINVLLRKSLNHFALVKLALDRKEWQILRCLLDIVHLSHENYIELIFRLFEQPYEPLDLAIKNNISALLGKNKIPDHIALLKRAIDTNKGKVFKSLLDYADLINGASETLFVPLCKQACTTTAEINIKIENTKTLLCKLREAKKLPDEKEAVSALTHLIPENYLVNHLSSPLTPIQKITLGLKAVYGEIALKLIAEIELTFPVAVGPTVPFSVNTNWGLLCSWHSNSKSSSDRSDGFPIQTLSSSVISGVLRRSGAFYIPHDINHHAQSITQPSMQPGFSS